MSHRVGFLAVLFALAFAGCGGDDSADSDPEVASATPSFSTLKPRELQQVMIRERELAKQGELGVSEIEQLPGYDLSFDINAGRVIVTIPVKDDAATAAFGERYGPAVDVQVGELAVPE